MGSRMIAVSCCLLCCTVAISQVAPTYGNRPIDLLPKSHFAEPEDYMPWGERPATEFELALHLKDNFRVGDQGIERLCVIEARRPEGGERALRLALTKMDGEEVWSASGDWIGPNQRMRAVWLPVAAADLRLASAGEMLARVDAPLGGGAPELVPRPYRIRPATEVDAGLALRSPLQSVSILHEGPIPDITFGASYADLRYTRPIKVGDETRTWDEIWSGSEKRDVVVSWPDSVARFVFWRGVNYVGCWALPEAWLTYEWLEAEPDFYGARGCVEPLQDKNCEHSKVEIIHSSPARVVVRWSYKLVDVDVRWIRGEHAEETFTFYPDGTGTRYLRAFVEPGWHENQEFIMINRPGRRPSDALDPQAITFYSPSGERQTPHWPKPGLDISDWPQVISIVNIKGGPRPFMVTPNAPRQVKMWADPYIDKPDIFNCYPHWPLTRGMETSWLEDPALYEHPTHSNLVNLVNDPIRESDGEEDYVWLIGTVDRAADVLDAARCWIEPGEVEVVAGRGTAEYSQAERAYVLAGVAPGEIVVTPAPDAPIVNPAFLVLGGMARGLIGTVEGAEETRVAVEGIRTIIWAKGTFAEPFRVRLEATD
ncbi:MAG TPA: hypothetical protein QGH10_26015 [Armatimonadota bacterium]|nr:hypothetical protein [Armatimonadota bacterium]